MTATAGPGDALPVIFENERLVAVDKPGGMLTVPSRMGADDPRPCLGRQLERQLGLRLWPVHRLDLEVSGLVLFAKDADAHRAAGAAFEQRRVHKHYEALTEGAERLAAEPSPGTFTWTSRLVRGKRRSFEAPHGKPAVTRARLLGRLPAGPWLPGGAGAGAGEGEGGGTTAGGAVATGGGQLLHFALEPETGRPHQLRVHLSRAGHPVLGDALYGAKLPFREPQTIALRSVAIVLEDPADREALGLAADTTLVITGFAQHYG